MTVMINKVASTNTASMATIVPATSSPRLAESSDTSIIGSRGPVVRVLPIPSSLISPGSVVSVRVTLGGIDPGGPLLPAVLAMLTLVGVSVGSFVGRGASIVVNCEKVVVNTEGEVMVGLIDAALALTVGVGDKVLIPDEEKDEGHE